MTNELMIGDRAAVPLRLLPFASMWLTPQTIVTALARHAGQFSLTAFHLHAGKATQIPRARWDNLKTQLFLLEDKMQRKENFEDQNFDKWQRKSLKLIPPRVFLWKDELIDAFEAEFSNLDDDDDRPSYYGPCEGDNALQLECHLTATDRDFVFAEFEQTTVAPRASLTIHTTTGRRDVISPVIDDAIEEAGSTDYQKVWAVLYKWADSQSSPPPLLGVSSDGITYAGKRHMETGEADTIKYEDLKKRIKRLLKKQPPANAR